LKSAQEGHRKESFGKLRNWALRALLKNSRKWRRNPFRRAQEAGAPAEGLLRAVAAGDDGAVPLNTSCGRVARRAALRGQRRRGRCHATLNKVLAILALATFPPCELRPGTRSALRAARAAASERSPRAHVLAPSVPAARQRQVSLRLRSAARHAPQLRGAPLQRGGLERLPDGELFGRFAALLPLPNPLKPLRVGLGHQPQFADSRSRAEQRGPCAG
jgi:hypothetical protein